MNSCFGPLTGPLRDVASPPLGGGAGGGGERRMEKIQVLQDLDLFYIKQIAHSLKEVELEQKMEVEMKMREGTTRLLAACKHLSQSLEAAKSLLTSNERMTAYLAELQKRKRHPALPTRETGGCTGRVCLSELRMPLIWRDTDHFKNKGDYRRFAVFCLLRIGTELYDTGLLCPVDRSNTDLTFPDVLVFNQVPADFSLQLEVYSHMLRDDLSMASTRKKIKNTIHNSISRTVGKKLAASLRDELNSGKIGPNFELMASARLTLDDVSDGIRTHDLKLEVSDAGRRTGDGLPLFGHFCCRLAARPAALEGEVYSSPTQGNGFASLRGFVLSLWPTRQAYLAQESPASQTPVNKDTVIKCTKSGCEVVLAHEREGKEESLTLRLRTAEEREVWIRHLTAHIRDHERWKDAAETSMEIYTPGSGKQNFMRTYRQGSLYDETPLIDNEFPPLERGAGGRRLTEQQLTPSTSLSSCSSSSSPQLAVRERSRSVCSKPLSTRLWPF